ncbi:auxin efflux carrier [Truncatella angustata]|uniref:Auxin efflux carrier n=1 Tax=Truncatella angustata TaxID=152316 RepID=A0A9P8UWK2_9PEZI|nr:auxin efflux carrier [Truncatella angustata]KAH6659667.1 auxin efflux carrier [Truncatella angustata]
MASNGLSESFLAAIQASLSVLLVIFYGVVAAKLNILDAKSTKAISKICVRVFLPALLITKLGSEVDLDSIGNYGRILIWALVCHGVSFLFGLFAHLVLHMPDWTTVALMFNNTTSYPLLLIGALGETGVLNKLLQGDESSDDATERAKAYFLIFSTVSSCLTFAVGPRLIDSENGPEDDEDDGEDGAAQLNGSGNGHSNQQIDGAGDSDEQTALLGETAQARRAVAFNGRSSFFPSNRKQRSAPSKLESKQRRARWVAKKYWSKLGPRAQWWLVLVSDFFNAPLLGAIIGAFIGLVPALKRAFFADATGGGGIFTAWLTASLKNIGGLFVPLPVVVAGVTLYAAHRDAQEKKKNKSSGEEPAKLPKLTVAYILSVRFVFWSALSISIIYGLASAGVLGSDPILWFTMMLMPVGSPAMKLIAMVQVSQSGDEDEAMIAKVLTIAYVISPILSFTVVGSLMASQACM